MRFLPRHALLCGALLFLFGASARPAAAQSGAIGIRGDVTADGNLTASDALAVLSHVVGKPLPATYTAALDGDADGNGQVTALDALVILGHVVGKDVARYPVGRRLLSREVGAAGGAVVSRLDSIRIDFPEGALAEAVNVTVEPATGVPAAPGLVPGSALVMGPDGQRFAKPVRLTLRYSPAAVPQGVAASELRIHRRAGDGWEEVPGGTVDVASGTITAELSGFSTYVVMPRAASAQGLSLVKEAGDGQTGTVGMPPADFLVARLVNAAGRGVPNQVLTWTVTAGGGSIRPLETRTDSAGRVRAVFTLGPDAGLNRVRVTAAGADSVVFTATGVSSAPSSIVVNGGADQTAPAGSAVATPPSVRVTDSRGNPVADVTVTFAVATGGGSITGATPKTDANGIAAVGSWTLGTTAGPNSLTASVEGGPSVTINATGIPGAAATISRHAGDGGTAVVGTTRALEAKVVDANGNGVAGVTVSWAVATGGGSLSAPSSTTDGSGVASTVWTFGGTAGAQSVTATSAGLAGSPLTFSATTTPAAASRLAITTQPSAAAQSGIAFPAQPVLRLQDQFGNPVAQSGVAVTAALASGTGTLGGTATVNTDAAGVATFTDLAIGGPVGAYTLGFSATGLTGATSGTINLAAGTAASLAVNAGDAQTAVAGSAVATAPSVKVTDGSGNPVSGVSVTFAVATGGGSVTGATQTTDAAGIATVGSWTLGTTAGANTLTATAGSLSATFSATGTAGAPANIAKTAGDGQSATAGSAVATAPSVTITDQHGNPVSGVAVTFAASGNGSVTGSPATTNASGVATVGSWTLATTAGANTLTATAGALSASFSATGTAGAPANITRTAGDGQSATAGSAVATAPSVTVTDQNGNPVSGVAVTFAASGNGSVTGSPATTNASGVATVGSWTLATTAGANTLTATAGALSASFSATGTVGAAANIAKTAGDGQTAAAGSAVATAPSVTVTDQYGNPVSGVSVTFAASGNGSVTGSPATTNASGVATVGSWTLATTAGANTLTATAGALSASFSATGTAGAAANITKTAGDGQSATAGSAVATAPSVTVTDQHGNPVSGVAVTFAASGNGSVTGSPATTDASGVATVGSWTLATTAGANTLTATAGALSASFSATGTVGAAANIAKTAGDGQTAAAGSTVATAPSVTVTDQYGNPVSGVSVTFAASGNGSVTGSPATTNASGVATVGSWTLATTAGANTLTASAGALSTSFSATGTAGAAASLAFTVQPSSAAAGAAISPAVQVTVLDAFGNTVTGAADSVAVAIGTNPAGGTLSGAVKAAPVSGVATFTGLSIDKAGTGYTLSATSGAVPAAPSAAFNVTAGAATQLAITTQPSDSVQSGTAFPRQPTLQLRDQYGNAVAQGGVSVTAAVASGAGTLGGTTTVTTDASGAAAFTDLAITGTVGDRTLAFSAGPLTGATSNTVHVRAGAASQLFITTQPSETVQGGTAFPRQPVVELRDASGNPVRQAGVTVTASIASGGGALGGTVTATTNASGVATFTNLSITGTAGDRTLSFAATGLTPATSATVSVTSGPPAQLAVTTQPSATAQAGVAFAQQPVVQLQDAAGNPAGQAGVTVTASIASGNPALGGTLTAVTDASGVATFTNLSIGGTAGSRTLRFSAPSLADTTSSSINVTAGPAAALAFSTQPSNAVASAAITPAVQVSVVDAYGNLVTGATDNVTLAIGTNPSGGSLSGTTTVGATGGVATFSGLSINLVGSGYTLTASSGTLGVATSAGFNVTHGPLHHFLVEAAGGGPIGSQLAGTPFNVRVTAQDEYNNTVTSFTGTTGFTSTPSGGISAGGTSGAFTAGVLSSHGITLGTPGSFTLTATNTAGAQSGTSNSFDVQAPPVAVNEGPAAGSAPGQPFHAFFSTSGSPQTFSLSAPGVLSNDNLGFPAATITSFGADSLGGSVTTYAAGSTVSPLPGTGRTTGSLSVGADGTITFTPPDGFTGNYVFRYRLTNVRGTSDGQVTIAVGARPAAVSDTYSPVLVGNVPINTATSTQFRVTSNDAGDAKTLAITGQSNGTATLNADSTFTFRPNAGFEGTASFTYTVTNGFGTSAPATVSMTVANPIWFVNAGAAAGGDGRYDAPFNSLGTLAAINNGTGSNPAASDRIFLYTGSYTGPLTLLSTQRLIGQGATASLSSIAGVTWPADAGAEPAMNGTAPTLTASGATALTLANVGSATTANNTLRGFNLGNVGAAGTALAGTSFGTLAISEVGINTDGRALNLSTGTLNGSFPQLRSTGGTNNVFLTSVATTGTSTLGTSSDALSGATGDALKIDGGNGSFTYAGSITNSATLAVSITNKNGGAVTVSGQINPAAAGRGISLGNNSSTTISFTGSAQKISTGAGAGVGLSGNNGSTISFTGGALEVATTTGNGINVNAGIAPSGGTLVISGANNTITSAGGVALNVANTTIGAGGLVFRSISANGGTSGIVLNNTGATAGLTVTGTGAAGTGGTIQNTTGDGVRLASTRNASLNWMNFSGIASAVSNVAACHANDASGCESAVDLSGATNVTLNRIAINGAGQIGISAHNSSGLTVTNTQVLNAGDADGESGILLHNLSGTSLIQDVMVDNPEEFGIKLFNTTGTAGLTLRRVTVQNNIGTFGEAGFQAEVSGGTTTALVDDSDFLNTDGTGVFGTSSATGVLNLTVQASVFTNNQALPSGINFTTGGTSTGRLRATDNTINGCATLCSQGMDLDASISSTLEATVLNNTITNAGIGTGIEFISNENSVARGRFEGNTVTVAADKIGFNFHSRSVGSTQAGSLDLTLKSNTINGITSAAAAYGGMTFQTGSSGALVHNNSMCVNLATAQGAGSNIVNGTNNPPLIYAYTVRQRPSTTFRFQGYTGAASSATDLEAFITANNPGGTMGGSAEVYDATATTAVNYTSGTCATPSATPTP